VRPILLKNRAYRVIDVRPEAPDVWTVRMAPPEGEKIADYLPGQFHFITFYRGRNLPVEEHHWTISSSPSQKEYVSSTIKALGDFTSTMGETRRGDAAAVQGAFGRFSYLFHPDERDLVFVAGGIGITPLMSMIRYMHDIGDTRNVVLFYSNRKEGQIVFKEELSSMEEGGHPGLKVIHIISSPGEGWTGETGYVNQDKIRKYCGDDLRGKAFYLCGPAGMINAVESVLKDMGVPQRQIRTEIFSFLD
jgi:ferredoxin-NADP reductase